MITPMPYQDPKDLVRGLIRTVPDWPKPGVMFRDITPMMQDPRAFRALIDMFVYRHMRNRLDAVVGIDARGFIFGSALAYALNVGFVPVRKAGKLPFKTVAQPYSLEYGDATVEADDGSAAPAWMAMRWPINDAGERHERVSIVFTPSAIRVAQGWRMVSAFTRNSHGQCATACGRTAGTWLGRRRGWWSGRTVAPGR